MSLETLPECFSDIDIVFPIQTNGLRMSPENCMACAHKTVCLKEALRNGPQVRNEVVDRAYAAGMIGFWGRWSRKKMLHQQAQNKLASRGRRSFFQRCKDVWESQKKYR